MQGQRLQKKLAKKNLEDLKLELQKQINEKIKTSLSSIPQFCKALEIQREWPEPGKPIWQEGSSQLYKYSPASENDAKETPPILIIPSLINRHYILDLEENNSFVKYLASSGYDTYLASWGEPLDIELEFSLDDYIKRITKMIEVIYKKTGKKIVLAGYCMGGLLSLAAAQGSISKIKSLAFFATPWNFHEASFPRFILNDAYLKHVEQFIDKSPKIPAVIIQALFYYLHSNLVGQKFTLYKQDGLQNYFSESFLAVENWANDGISMTKNVAKECFLGWVQNNNVAKLKWKINGKIVSPKSLSKFPAFFAIASKDSVVPPASTTGLTKYFSNCHIVAPNAGHVGMMVGNGAKKQTWEPFVDWLEGR